MKTASFRLIGVSVALSMLLAPFSAGAGAAPGVAPPARDDAPGHVLPKWAQPILLDDDDGQWPIVSEPVVPKTSRPLRDLPTASLPAVGKEREISPPRNLGGAIAGTDTRKQDPLAVLGVNKLLASPAPILNFEGQGDFGMFTPPDTTGDVGPNHYFQIVNVSYSIYDKSGNQLAGPIANNALWAGFGGPCETDNDGDPIVLYDDMADRWLVSQFAVSGHQHECIAISTSPDPLGTYYLYGFAMPDFPDYPKFGVWHDGYYLGTNTGLPNQYYAHVFDRASMLAGLPATLVSFGGHPNFLMPADADGLIPPPPGSPGYFYTFLSGGYPNHPPGVDRLAIYELAVDWATPANSTFTLVNEIPISAFNYTTCGFFVRECIPQLGTAQRLDGVDAWPMVRLQYRNLGSYEAMVGNFTVDVDGTDWAGIRWFELRKQGANPWSLHQEGTYAPDSDNRWMGSIAMDGSGNIALGYSVSSGTMHPAIRYATRGYGDPLGTLQAEASLMEGGGSQTGVVRWGDYSAMNVDPVDQCTFWITNEYHDVDDTGFNWNTRIGTFRVPGCTGSLGPVGYLDGTVTDSSTSDPIEGANVQAAGLVPTHTNATASNAAGYYRMVLPTDTYTVTASAYGYLPAEIGGASVVSGTTTTVDIALDLAPTYVVSGYVYDATAGWPLYANVDVVPVGFPGLTVWNDPVSGYYSITLPAGMTYTFRVDAWVSGYDTASRDIFVTGDRIEDFGLDADLVACVAPGYDTNPTLLLSEDFDAGIPIAWTVVNNGGTCVWRDDDPDGRGNLTGGAGIFAIADSDYCGSGTTMNTDLETPVFDASAYTGLEIEYKNDYYDLGSTAQVDVYDGSAWVTIDDMSGESSRGPETRAVRTPAGAGVVNAQVRWHYDAGWDWWWEVDEVRIYGANCAPQSGGLVVGNVYDENYGFQLVGAEVVNEDGYMAAAEPVPADPAVDDGFYTVFSPPGSRTFTATMVGGYGPDVQTPTVVQSDTVQQDFDLPAGDLWYDPRSYDVTQALGMSVTLPFTLYNFGGLAAGFEMVELDKGMTILGPFESPVGLVKPHKQNRLSAVGVSLREQPQAAPLAAGDIIQSWPTNLTYGWGIGYNTMATDMWIGNIAAAGGDDLNYRFLTDGTNTGDTIDTSPWVGAFAADMTYNPNTGMLWQLDVGGDNCIHEMDPASMTTTGNTICPAFGASQRGLAYDPTTDVYFAGSWNDQMVYRFAPDGTVLESVMVGLNVSGLAYNPDTQHLFAQTSDVVPDTYVLDAANSFALLGQFSIAGMGDGAGMEMDCDGNLWVVDQDNQQVLQVESGETTSSLCGFDVPWLSEDPISGTVPSALNQPIDITFDAGRVPQPGVYKAQLKVAHDTPYDVPKAPVTMTVTAPPDWGKLEGTVYSLGYCDMDVIELEGAELLITGTSGMTWTLTTDISGTYSYWFDEVESPLTLTVTAPEHAMEVIASVQINRQSTTTQDVFLRWLEPCVGVEAPALEATLDMGLSMTLPLSVSNTGAVSTVFKLTERDGGFQPTALSLLAGRGEWLHRSVKGVLLPTNYANEALAYPSAYRWRPAWWLPSAPSALNILIYADDFVHTAPNTYLDQALQAMGLAYTAHYDGDFAGFETSLTTGGPWDLVLVGNDNYGLSGTTLTALDDYVTSGGKLIIHSWRVSANLGHALWTTLGFTFVSDVTTGDDVYWWDPGHVMFEGVPEFIGLVAAGGIQGQRVEPLSGFEALAGYTTPGPDPNEAGLILGNDGRTVFRGFLDAGNDLNNDADATLDGVELWMNLIDGIQFGFSGDAPWLFEDPISGTLPADTGIVVADVTLDAAYVAQPGEYYATLSVRSDDPINHRVDLPVTMTVNAPATWGKLEGTVSSRGHCDVNLAPLEGAQVVIENGSVVTLTTDVSGTYSYWLEQGTYTVTVSAAEHQTGTAGVTVVQQTTTVQDFGLRWLEPCVNVEAPTLQATLDMGLSTTFPVSVSNTGAVSTVFRLAESERGFQPMMQSFILAGGGDLPLDTARVGSAPASLLQFGESDVTREGPILNRPDAPMQTVLLDQAPNQSNGIFADAGCDSCGGGPQVLAENFALSTQETIGQIVFWTGYHPGDVPVDPDTIAVIFHADAAGLPGAVIAAEANVPYARAQTGIILFGVHEWMHTLTLANPVTLGPGTYWVEIYNDTGFGTDDMFWEVGNPDTVGNGLPGSAYAFTAPGSGWSLDGVNDLSIQLIRGDVPWLFEDPISGTLDADTGSEVVSVTLDAAYVAQPGEYYATLGVSTDDPFNRRVDLPVTMTVNAPATWGKLEGTVSGLGYCDVFTAPLENAEVFVESWMTETFTYTYPVVLAIEDFEASDGGYVADPLSEWAWGVPTYPVGISAHSGVNVWGTDLHADADDTIGDHLLTTTLALPANAERLAWWDWYGDEASDERRLYISTTLVWDDNGGTDQREWVEHSVDVSAWAGQTVDVVFDLNVCCGNPGPDGWYIDDVSIVRVAEAQAERQVSWLLETDEHGYYSYWFDQVYSPLTLTVTYPEHEAGMAAGVTIAGQATTVQDFDLRWLQPCVSVAPVAMEATLMPGESEAQTLTLTNDGAVLSDFRLREREGGVITFTTLSRNAPLGGGPDAFGYTWMDSNEPGGPIYQWVDISGTGTPVLLGDDDFDGPFPIGFAFNYYGGDMVEFYVSSNGHIDFGSGSTSLGNQCPLPDSNTPNHLVALMWDDLDPGDTGDPLYYETFSSCPYGGGACLVVQYENYHHYPGGGTIAGTFEAILFENGSILIQFENAGDEAGSGSTTGIEDSTGSDGLTYGCDTAASLQDLTAVCFAYPGESPNCSGADVPWLSEDPITGTVVADNVFDVSVTFTAFPTMTSGIYTATLVAVTDDPVARTVDVPVTLTVAGPETGWEKLVSINGVPTSTVGRIIVFPSDTVQIVDRIWVTYTVPITFSLTEEWGESLVLTDALASDGTLTPGPGSLTWDVGGGAPNAWYVLTKTFLVTGTVWVFDDVTETLWVEYAYPQPDSRVLTFRNGSVCWNVGIVDLASDSPVTVGDAMHFTATVDGDGPITYTWDFYSDGTPDATGAGLSTVAHTYASTGTYTVTLDVENGCPSTDTASIVVRVKPVCVKVVTATLGITSIGTIYTDTVVTFSADIAPDDASKPYTYTVDYGAGPGAPAVSSADPLVFTTTFATTGTHTVEIAVWNCGMAEPVTATVQVEVTEYGVCVDLTDITIMGATEGAPGVYTFTTAYAPYNASLPISYAWDDGGTEARSVRTLGVGTTTLVVTATNCTAALVTDTHEIVISGLYIYLPLVLRNH